MKNRFADMQCIQDSTKRVILPITISINNKNSSNIDLFEFQFVHLYHGFNREINEVVTMKSIRTQQKP